MLFRPGNSSSLMPASKVTLRGNARDDTTGTYLALHHTYTYSHVQTINKCPPRINKTTAHNPLTTTQDAAFLGLTYLGLRHEIPVPRA